MFPSQWRTQGMVDLAPEAAVPGHQEFVEELGREKEAGLEGEVIGGDEKVEPHLAGPLGHGAGPVEVEVEHLLHQGPVVVKGHEEGVHAHAEIGLGEARAGEEAAGEILFPLEEGFGIGEQLVLRRIGQPDELEVRFGLDPPVHREGAAVLARPQNGAVRSPQDEIEVVDAEPAGESLGLLHGVRVLEKGAARSGTRFGQPMSCSASPWSMPISTKGTRSGTSRLNAAMTLSLEFISMSRFLPMLCRRQARLPP